MKERPILFSAPMVRAILDGTKTQTRRVVKPQPAIGVTSIYTPFKSEPNNWQGVGKEYVLWYGKCPYGQVGDQLWVRETFAHHVIALSALDDREGPFVYAADGSLAKQMRLDEKWKPSIFMPRYASRIQLEITNIRVEELNWLSEADAKAEGAEPAQWYCAPGYEQYSRAYTQGYYKLWESINGAGSWAKNPWVWVIEFKKI
jgi:hypothetical protein